VVHVSEEYCAAHSDDAWAAEKAESERGSTCMCFAANETGLITAKNRDDDCRQDLMFQIVAKITGTKAKVEEG
jgi:hypothetical protein